MSLTVTTLETYFDGLLGDLKAILSISTYNNMISDTLMSYGLSASYNLNDAALNVLLADVTDETKFTALSRVSLWKLALGLSSSKYKQSADGASLDRNQMHDMCLDNLKMALSDAAEFDSNAEIKIYQVHSTENPYSYDPDRIER